MATVPSQDHRAISVPLAGVKRGQPRVLADNRTARSAAMTAVIRQIPKLIVGVRFPSPALTRFALFTGLSSFIYVTF
jgi:hypothetical protein